MATLNRILIVIITLLAIAAAVMSYLLFERRDAFRERASVLAETVVDMVRSLDEESQTDLADQVTFSRKEDTLPEDGTLGWQAFNENPENVKQVLSRAENLADAINTQRNYLANDLEQIAFTLGLPVEELSAEQLMNADDEEIYQKATAKIVALARAVDTRGDDMITRIVETSNVLDPQLVDPENFRERIQDVNEDGETVYEDFKHEGELDKFKDAVTALHRRAKDYGDALAAEIDKVSAWDWSTTANQVTDPNAYTTALLSLSDDFGDINDRLILAEQERVKLEQTEEQLARTKDSLKQVTEERNELQVTTNEQRAEIKRLEGMLSTKSNGGSKTVVNLPENIEGHVLHVNDEYKFVILDLGSQQIPENTELIVARGDEPIARVLVTRVTASISVAEILPSATLSGPVRENDRVIPPKAL